MKLLPAIARATVLTEYLRSYREILGPEEYLSSLIRREHGSGAGFFGVKNSGSHDCLRESIRKITDALGFTYRTPGLLLFRTTSCEGITQYDRALHRIEHTTDVQHLYLEIEQRFILGDEPISPHVIGDWVIRNQIATWIRQKEQLRVREFSYDVPFSKYTAPVLFRDGSDVSHLSREEIRSITEIHFTELLAGLRATPMDDAIMREKDRLTGRPAVKHTLPSLDLAVSCRSSMYELLSRHYRHKLRKRTDPASAWFDEEDAQAFRRWEQDADLGSALLIQAG